MTSDGSGPSELREAASDGRVAASDDWVYDTRASVLLGEKADGRSGDERNVCTNANAREALMTWCLPARPVNECLASMKIY
jgi:hypothetical protein